MLFLASMGETGLTNDIFFEFSLGPFEVVEAEGGRLVKEANFEAVKKVSNKNKLVYSILQDFFCIIDQKADGFA